jgi:hypothetical protein
MQNPGYPKERHMERTVTTRRIDFALNYVVERTETIATAHAELGAPLDDLICHAIRQSFLERASDQQQMTLPVDVQDHDHNEL